MIGCFGAPFIQYDDSAHVDSPIFADATSAWDYFVPKVGTSYIPIAMLSYKADRWLHAGWAEKCFGSWAPGVRLDTLLLHAGAALFLWRLLTRLRFSERRAFFIALLFSVHPLVCETVCWVSERKNALSALFGFAALWTQSLALPPVSQPDVGTFSGAAPFWRWPATCVLFGLALLGKPSALGLLPIMALLECVYRIPAIQARLFEAGESGAESSKSLVPSIVGLAALVVIAYVCLRVNLFTHTGDIVAPPGGTVFTALLTDLEIFSRYFFSLVYPIRLSGMYYVEPILGPGDARAWTYGAIFFGTLAVTIFFARNRWLCAFGWVWFLSAMGTNANVIAIVHWMQDRYLYLAAPGFWIAISEMAAGMNARYASAKFKEKLPLALGAVFVAICIPLTATRGYVWSSMYELSLDATRKQPQSFYAHYGLGGVLFARYKNAQPGSPHYEATHQAWRNEFLIALEKCPDAERYNFRQWVATELGIDAYSFRNVKDAERFFKIGATKSTLAPDLTESHSTSLAYLCMLDLYLKRDPAAALEKARESLRLMANDYGRFALVNAAAACARQDPKAKEELVNEARKALAEISKDSGLRNVADALLKEIK